MENLSEIDLNEFAKVVLGNEELKQRFDAYIYDAEINDFIGNKIDCFENDCINYQYGVCCHCYLKVKEDRYFDVLDGMKKSAENYGCSTRLEKMLNHADKLWNSNLFHWYVKKALEIYFKEEIKKTIEWVEDMNYKLYCGMMSEDMLGELECFQWNFDGYLYDRENKTFYKPFSVA